MLTSRTIKMSLPVVHATENLSSYDPAAYSVCGESKKQSAAGMSRLIQRRLSQDSSKVSFMNMNTDEHNQLFGDLAQAVEEELYEDTLQIEPKTIVNDDGDVSPFTIMKERVSLS